MISKAKLDRYLEKVENDPGLIGEAAGLKRSLLQDAVWMLFCVTFVKIHLFTCALDQKMFLMHNWTSAFAELLTFILIIVQSPG